jgi:hypothetical protein
MTGELGGLERAMDDVDPQVDDGVLKDGGGKSKRCDSVPQLRRPVGLLFRSTNGRRDFKALACELARRKFERAGRKPRRRHRLKLMFESPRGREEYRRVVGGVRCRWIDVKCS